MKAKKQTKKPLDVSEIKTIAAVPAKAAAAPAKKEDPKKDEKKKVKHIPTPLEILNRGNIIFSALQFIKLNEYINRDRSKAPSYYVHASGNAATGSDEATMAEAFDDRIITSVGIETFDDVKTLEFEFSDKALVKANLSELQYISIDLPHVMTDESALSLALKYIGQKYYNHPCVPSGVFTLERCGKAYFNFPNKKVVVRVGKDSEFSLKEAFACALADYVCGTRVEFESMFNQVKYKEQKMTCDRKLSADDDLTFDKIKKIVIDDKTASNTGK